MSLVSGPTLCFTRVASVYGNVDYYSCQEEIRAVTRYSTVAFTWLSLPMVIDVRCKIY